MKLSMLYTIQVHTVNERILNIEPTEWILLENRLGCKPYIQVCIDWRVEWLWMMLILRKLPAKGCWFAEVIFGVYSTTPFPLVRLAPFIRVEPKIPLSDTRSGRSSPKSTGRMLKDGRGGYLSIFQNVSHFCHPCERKDWYSLHYMVLSQKFL